MKLAGVNPLVGTPVVADENGAAVETLTPGAPIIATEAGIEWIVAALALGALGVIILFKLAGFRAAIAVKGGIG